jgi:hypothetical protein
MAVATCTVGDVCTIGLRTLEYLVKGEGQVPT